MSFGKFLEGMVTNTLSDRSTALREEFKGIIVDTCYCSDVGCWETGIKVKEESFVIVEEYKDEEEAKKGHKKWVSKLKKNPKLKLKECRTAEEWFFG